MPARQRVNGEAIRVIRERGDRRQAEIALATGMNRTHRSHIEAGRRRPSASVARRLAEALKVPLAAVLVDPDPR